MKLFHMRRIYDKAKVSNMLSVSYLDMIQDTWPRLLEIVETTKRKLAVADNDTRWQLQEVAEMIEDMETT